MTENLSMHTHTHAQLYFIHIHSIWLVIFKGFFEVNFHGLKVTGIFDF